MTGQSETSTIDELALNVAGSSWFLTIARSAPART
jgi:hypothetical protein